MASNTTSNASFVYSTSNGSMISIPKSKAPNITSYSTALASCQASGGSLVSVDSSTKQEVVQGLIQQHLQAFGGKTVNYLIGKTPIVITKTYFNTFKTRSLGLARHFFKCLNPTLLYKESIIRRTYATMLSGLCYL